MNCNYVNALFHVVSRRITAKQLLILIVILNDYSFETIKTIINETKTLRTVL